MYRYLKRSGDFVVALIALVALSPVLAVLALWIKTGSEGPVFYRGRRTGLKGRPFEMLKFRTMVVNADRIGGPSTSDRDPRITGAGLFLRKWKLDELPQFINVLKGEMSFVGPRPEVQKYTDMFTAEEKAILDVRPGITDWASIWNADEGAVLARHPDPDKAYEELIRPGKIKLQLKYAREYSFAADVKIVFYTLAKLLQKEWVPAELRPFGRPGKAGSEIT